jgi:hypothetical protein
LQVSCSNYRKSPHRGRNKVSEFRDEVKTKCEVGLSIYPFFARHVQQLL